MKEEIRQKLTGAVIGLARTCENNEKTENTNRVFLEALTVAGDWSASIFDMSEMLEKVRNEKYTVSPGCVTCAAPCGNTDDYDMENLWKESEENNKKESNGEKGCENRKEISGYRRVSCKGSNHRQIFGEQLQNRSIHGTCA